MRTPEAAMCTSAVRVHQPWQIFQRWRLQLPEGLLQARKSLGRPRVILGRADGGRSRGRTRCALLTRDAFRDDTIGSRGFIAAVTRTVGPRPFGGAGL